jgi:hypothetical protein
LLTVSRNFMNVANCVLWRMAIFSNSTLDVLLHLSSSTNSLIYFNFSFKVN